MRFFSSVQSNRGFSLVELLVVISIISILSAVVYANFTAARQSARDNIRKADLKDLQLALELYKAQNGEYPDACTDGDTGWKGNGSGSYNCASGKYIADIVPGYMPALPVDPTFSKNPANTGYLYRVSKSGGKNVAYKLLAFQTVEKAIITSYDDDFARCPAIAAPACPDPLTVVQNKTYAVYNGSGVSDW